MTDHTHEQPVIVQNDGGGNGLAMIVGALLVLALLVGIWYFALGPGGGTTDQQDINVTVPEVDVNVQPSAPAP